MPTTLHANIIRKPNTSGQAEKPLIILHGFLGMGDNWKTLANGYADEGYEVHLIDQRNHGRSFHHREFSYPLMAADLLDYCQQQGLEQFDLMGHSMGGKTAMFFAALHPEKVKRLLVVDIAPKGYPQHHQDILKGLTSLDFTQIKTRKEADAQLAKYVSDAGIRQFLLKNLYRKSQTEFGLRINLPALVENIEEVGKALPRQAVYSGPTLFLRGDRSGYITTVDEPHIRQHFPKAEIVTIARSGHWLHAENPQDFFRDSLRFLQGE